MGVWGQSLEKLKQGGWKKRAKSELEEGRERKCEIGRVCWGQWSHMGTVMDDVVGGDGGLF